MKLLIVEDEALLAKALKNMVLAIEPHSEIAGHTNSIESTVQWLQEHDAPDLILMDIELADGQCFEIFNRVPVQSPVIFTTAYDEYTLRAFKVNSVDYLLKPIKETELRAAITKWKTLHAEKTAAGTAVQLDKLLTELKKTALTSDYRDRFLVKQGQKMLSVLTADIAYFCAKNTLTFLVTKAKQKFVVDYTLDELEQVLNPKHFFRANRQYIVAHDLITAIHPWFNGKVKADVAVPVEDDLIISRDKAPLFKAWLGE
jgi:two-component system, LytTR family, response regulator LytT